MVVFGGSRVHGSRNGSTPKSPVLFLGAGDDPAVAPRSRADQVAAKTLEAYQKAAFEDSSAWRAEDALLQVVPSSQLVKTDENGDPYQDR